MRNLTRRQAQVFDLIARGHTNKEIARKLRISHRTVEDHRHDIMLAYRVRNIAELFLAHVAKTAECPICRRAPQ